MTKSFRNINFPPTYKYSSDSDFIPLEFYEETFPISERIDLLLGYFSSNAIKVLSKSFAEFIYSGGKMRLVTNHVYSLSDYENLIDNSQIQDEDKIINIFSDLSEIEKNLSKEGLHFFDCLKYLLKKKKLQIVPVKFNGIDLAHCKQMILYDGNDYIVTEGSINFTLPALIKNSESFHVEAPWNGDVSLKRIEDEKRNFEAIFNKSHPSYEYIDKSQIEVVINSIGKDKDIKDLLDDSAKLGGDNYSKKIKRVIANKKEQFNLKVQELSDFPKFPFQKPFPYQIEAYKKWIDNSKKGLFAMATGTGKTLTSIYCLIKEHNENQIQKNIIVVPGEELVRQWSEELRNSNFKSIFSWYSKNKNLNTDINKIRILKNSDKLNIVITYDSFKSSKKFKNIFNNDLTDYIVVFDEAHNMGADGFMRSNKDKKFKRVIGLSATPLRLWDENEENKYIEDFFNSPPPYTFSYSMEKAIQKGFLCKYNYYPYFTYLTNQEWEEYLEQTKKIPLGKDGEINTTAALRRQLLLDQAENKSSEFIKILGGLYKSKSHKYTLVYCPKGQENEARIIYTLGQLVNQNFSNRINAQFFLGETKDRDMLLKEFEDGEVDLLLAIKCLDEGVNVPKTVNAVFLASGKNYREFVQRRGRVLRNYSKNGFVKKFANIYDIVVLPTIEQYTAHKEVGKKLITNEFKRLYEFYKMAIPNEDTFWGIEQELEKYNLTQYYLESQIKENE